MRHKASHVYFTRTSNPLALALWSERPVIIKARIIDPQRSGGADRAHVVTLGASFGKVEDTLFHK